MSGHKRILALVLAAVLALTAFPFTASATGEDVLEPAPEVVLPEVIPEEEGLTVTVENGNLSVTDGADDPVTAYSYWDGDPYLPFVYSSGYKYTGDADEVDNVMYYDPYLEPSEYKRAMELLAAVEAGEQSLAGIRCPEYENEVKIGVYPLDPGDFNGETYYVMIPQRKLNDHDLLYLISCFRKLGIPFEPKEWNSRNCMRGYYANGANRNLSEEEGIRMAALRHQTANGFLTEADIHPETECKSIMTLYGPFCFYPYRCMTDDELAAFALAKDPVWPNKPDEVEKAAREFIADYIRMPLSMKLTEAELSWSSRTGEIEGYQLIFQVEYTDAYGTALRTDGKPCGFSVYLRRRLGDGAVIGCSAGVSYYSDYSVLEEKGNAGPLSKDEIYAVGKQWLLDTLGLDETKYAWWNNEVVPGGYCYVWADNSDLEFHADVYPDGSVERLSIRDLKLPGNFIGDEYTEEAGTPPVSLEELLEQATQAPPEAVPTEVTAAVDGKMAGENYTWSEEPYLPDLYTPDYRHLQEPDENLMYNNPWLEPGEVARAKELLAAVEAGKKSIEKISYPEHPDELKVGVYPLDPAEFSGETYYVTLPTRKLKDHDLLYLISCFEQLGIPFEPENLNSRNCMRAFYTRGATRELSEEESERMETLAYRASRGLLTEADIHAETECRSVDTWFGTFCFYPYRRMTDDELAAFALAREGVWEDHPDAVETAARKFAEEIIKLPLAMKLSKAERFRISYSDTAEGYGVTFRIDYTDAAGNAVLTEGKPCEVYVYLRKRMDNGALSGDTIRVDYYSDYSLIWAKENAKALPEEELLEIGKQWYRDNLAMDDDSYNYQIEKIEWNSFWWVWAYPADYSWAYFVMVSPDGSVETFSAQKVETRGV